MSPSSAPAADLFAWHAVAEAEAACARAAGDRAEAERKYRYPPRGTREKRLADLQEASKKLLAAEIALAEARRAAGITQ